MATIATGTKYDASRDVVDIAKLVRSDIRTADGVLSGVQVGVRVERGFPADSIVTTVKGLGPQVDPRYGKARDIRLALEAILAAYNRDASEHTTDYSEVRFHAEVRFAV